MGSLSIMSDTVSMKDYCKHNIIEINNITQEFVKFNLSTEYKLEIINLGIFYAKKFISNIKEYIIDSEEELLQNKFN
jgi:hypothetical protein